MKIVDRELLHVLKSVWRAHGCGFCGRTAVGDVPSGYDVELAHIHGRGMGGGKRQDTVEEILGLCGDLTPNRCHRRLDTHEIELYRNQFGDERWSVKHGEPLQVGRLRLKGGHVRRPRALVGTGGGPPSLPPPVPTSGPELQEGVPKDVEAVFSLALTEGDGHGVQGDPETPFPLPGHETPSPSVSAEVSRETNGQLATPENRLTVITALVRRSEESRVAASLLLLAAWEGREYEALDMTWPEYYAAAGLVKSDVSKMLKVAGTFRDLLVPVDQPEVSLERYYLGARLVSEREMDKREALDLAVAMPTHELVATLKREPVAEKHECPGCGALHTVKDAEAH